MVERGVEPEQNLERSGEALKESARPHEEQQNWAAYAMARNNLRGTYQVLAQRGVEPEQNLRSADQAFKEASARAGRTTLEISN